MGKDIETLKNTIKTIKNDTIKEQEKDIKNYKELMEQIMEELKETNHERQKIHTVWFDYYLLFPKSNKS